MVCGKATTKPPRYKELVLAKEGTSNHSCDKALNFAAVIKLAKLPGTQTETFQQTREKKDETARTDNPQSDAKRNAVSHSCCVDAVILQWLYRNQPDIRTQVFRYLRKRNRHAHRLYWTLAGGFSFDLRRRVHPDTSVSSTRSP